MVWETLTTGDGRLKVEERKHINDRFPNFYSQDGVFYLLQCFACDKNGRQNGSAAVSSGKCDLCGWDNAGKK